MRRTTLGTKRKQQGVAGPLMALPTPCVSCSLGKAEGILGGEVVPKHVDNPRQVPVEGVAVDAKQCGQHFPRQFSVGQVQTGLVADLPVAKSNSKFPSHSP